MNKVRNVTKAMKRITVSKEHVKHCRGWTLPELGEGELSVDSNSLSIVGQGHCWALFGFVGHCWALLGIVGHCWAL